MTGNVAIDHRTLDKRSHDELVRLFTSVFSASEGEDEGRLIGMLVSELSSGLDNQESLAFGAYDEESVAGALVGAIFLTRLRFKEDIQVYLLAPVAVSTAQQGKGIGQALIRHGLRELKNRSVAIAITYGDPSYYSRVGFEPLSEERLHAPFKLSMPHGWLGQSLTGEPIPVIHGLPECVAAFNDPAFW